MTQNSAAQPWELRYIEPGTEEYDQAKEVRYQGLYADLGLPRELVEDTDGRTYRHLAALVDGLVVGYARIQLEGGASRIFQVAVAPAWRRRGIARSLVAALIDLARSEGRTQVELDARAHVVGLYEHFGFVVEGPEFLSTRTNTPHFSMRLTVG